MLNSSIHHVSFHCPSSIDNLHQTLDAFYKQVHSQMQCLTKQTLFQYEADNVLFYFMLRPSEK